MQLKMPQRLLNIMDKSGTKPAEKNQLLAYFLLVMLTLSFMGGFQVYQIQEVKKQLHYAPYSRRSIVDIDNRAKLLEKKVDILLKKYGINPEDIKLDEKDIKKYAPTDRDFVDDINAK